ncbi:hypothetical protein [Streptomyces klenkii]
MGRIASIVIGVIALLVLGSPVATADTIGAGVPEAVGDLVASTLATTDEVTSFVGGVLG